MCIAPRCSRIKIRIPKLEIRNKPKHSNPKIEIRNEIIWNFMHFDHLDLFRISDFRFLLLFVLGVLCVFARIIFSAIPEFNIQLKISNIFA
jgi:hypothetical protein